MGVVYLRVEEFDYEMPEELIANTPLEKRDVSRLMVLNRAKQTKVHTYFKRLPCYLKRGDVIVLNNTRVIPARLFGSRKKTGGKLEMVILHPLKGEEDCWEALVKPGKRAKIGAEFVFGGGMLEAEIIDITGEGTRIVKFNYAGESFKDVLKELGKVPLPPYIKKELKDPDKYQTVYAKEDGSVAAPTAGLHFTPELIKKIKSMGIDIVELTLHVGLGTFRPVQSENIEEHKMHSEFFIVDREAAKTINKTKNHNGRVIAVGTTVVRTLETVANEKSLVNPGKGWTDLFICPGYDFQVVDALVTNFHLPRSTLLMLVSAFAGKEFIMEAYKEAIEMRYRFYSFGDAMFIY